MIDGIKLLNLWVSVEGLLQNSDLLFPLPVEETTGAVLDQRRRYATDRGLTFTLIPALTGNGHRCELNGSLHKYRNAGHHNADDFRAADLLAVLDDLILRFGIDPFRSRLNGIEFGVNVVLPFPVNDLLTRLISYKGVPFTMDRTGIYYQAETEQYVVKVYDKGSQYRNDVPGLPANVLRVEVKVRKMRYLTDKGLHLNTLADLLTVEHYPALGAILSETFGTILFDEPLVTKEPPVEVKSRDRELLREGRYAGYWQRPEGLTGKEYHCEQKRLKRDETRFRALLNQYRPGRDWQTDVVELIRQKWVELATVTADTRAAITDRLTGWTQEFSESTTRGRTVENCPLFTDLQEPTTDRETLEEGAEIVRYSPTCQNSDLSVIHPLYLVGIPDIIPTDEGAVNVERGTPVDEVNVSQSNVEFFESIKKGVTPVDEVVRQSDQPTRYCLVTGLDITHQPTNTRFVSTSTVRRWYDFDRHTFDTLAGRFLTLKQAGADLDKQCYHIAHNIRNAHTNPRNNPIRRLKRYVAVSPGQTLPLFPAAATVQPTDRQLTALEHRRGTRWDMGL